MQHPSVVDYELYWTQLLRIKIRIMDIKYYEILLKLSQNEKRLCFCKMLLLRKSLIIIIIFHKLEGIYHFDYIFYPVLHV